MPKKKELLKLNEKIRQRTERHYKNNKYQARLHNWWGRCVALIIKGRLIWPPISPKELDSFFISSGFPRQYWRKGGEKRNN